MNAQPAAPLATSTGGLRAALTTVAIVSGVSNALALTGSLYMLQVYDRVLSSHSVPTLVVLTVLIIGLYFFQGTLDVLRGQMMVRVGARLDQQLSPMAHRAARQLPLMGTSSTQAVQPVRDVDTIRAFVAGPGPLAIFDFPWIPLYLAFVFFLHPWLGYLAIAGVLIVVTLTVMTEVWARKLNAEAVAAGATRLSLVDADAKNAEVVRAMGMAPRADQRFANANLAYLGVQSKASDLTGGMSGATRVFRMFLQSAVIGLGAYLTLQGQVTAGAIIAASIATSRGLAPIEIAVGNWKGFVAARQAYRRLVRILSTLPVSPSPIQLPAPESHLSLEDVSVAVPGTQRLILKNITFRLDAGQGLGVIGPSAAGKSTLARTITGVWSPLRGVIRLDDAALDRRTEDDLGRYVGYLPQSVLLFDATIAENIARLEHPLDSDAIIRAAQAAGVHSEILKLPDGYETRLGAGGHVLSAGQQQRIALARALYRDPFLVVLDEPNSNLDADGERALTAAIESVRERGGIVIVIAHRPSAISAVDQVAMLRDGQLVAFGGKDEVLGKVLQHPAASSA